MWLCCIRKLGLVSSYPIPKGIGKIQVLLHTKHKESFIWKSWYSSTNNMAWVLDMMIAHVKLGGSDNFPESDP